MRVVCDIKKDTCNDTVFVFLHNMRKSNKDSVFRREHFLFYKSTSQPQFVHPGANTSGKEKKNLFVIAPLWSLLLLAISVVVAACVLPKKKLQKKQTNNRRVFQGEE